MSSSGAQYSSNDTNANVWKAAIRAETTKIFTEPLHTGKLQYIVERDAGRTKIRFVVDSK